MRLRFTEIEIASIPGARLNGTIDFYYDESFEMVFAREVVLDPIGEFPALKIGRYDRHLRRRTAFDEIEDLCAVLFADEIDALIPEDPLPSSYRQQLHA